VKEIKKWLADGVDVNARNSDGSTPISMAVLGGQTTAVKLLIEEGANVDSQNNDGHSSLHGAAFFGQLAAAQLLIEAGADVNLRNDTGETPFDVATVRWTDEAKEIVEFIARLVQVKVDVADVKAARPKVTELLLTHGGKSGADLPRLAGRDIWESAKLGDLVALKQFLTEKEDLDGHDDKGITPLCWAAMAGQTDAMAMLIAAGADVNSLNRDGGTALHAAAFLGHRNAVEWLIGHNVKINVKNGRGETPLSTVDSEWDPQIQRITQFIATILKLKLDIAEVKAARPEIAKLLRQHGGETGAQ